MDNHLSKVVVFYLHFESTFPSCPMILCMPICTIFFTSFSTQGSHIHFVQISLQEITTFLTENFGLKNPYMVFLPPCPTWSKCHFGQVYLDPTILTRSFWLPFFTRFYLLNHQDNNIIWATTKKYFI
jgi:hypothetical protein